MSEIMRPVSFDKLVERIEAESARRKTLFGIPLRSFFYSSASNARQPVSLFGQRLSVPIGPAAGPHTQLAGNIVSAYLCGARFFELKTVQTQDGEALRKCVSRPCIKSEDECYNVEWSTELTVAEAQEEYIKAWFLIHMLAAEYGLDTDVIFNMSVGYSLDGVRSPKIDSYINGMKDASQTAIWQECHDYLKTRMGSFRRFNEESLAAIPVRVSNNVTVSTLHGCPREEIERIASHLLTEKRLHTYVKCNPTLLGYKDARALLDLMGYRYVSFDEHHFTEDLQYADALAMFGRLQKQAESLALAFGVKITNTFPVEIKRDELPGNEMYMSGRALLPLSLTVASRLARDFAGLLPISYSGGADFFNLRALLSTGLRPITFAATLLKPGGYTRIAQLAQEAGNPTPQIDPFALSALADAILSEPRYHKEWRDGAASRKGASPLPLFDCGLAPCRDNGCPIHQRIPEYLALVNAGDYAGAFALIAEDNAAPSITGAICNHNCQRKCTRLDYEDSLSIREAKLAAADRAQEAYIAERRKTGPAALRSDKKVAVVGAGPAGVAAAVCLREAGVAVCVYDKREKPFGAVSAVIPAFRIADAAIERDFRMAEALGVEFHFNEEVTNFKTLLETHAAVIAATGAWKAGRSVGGALDALDFLERSKKSALTLELGKRVAVIGGGDVAMDCARAAKRNRGVQSVTIVYRRTRQEMPAQKEELEAALADGVEILELLSPLSYVNAELHSAELHSGTLTCEVQTLGDYDASGRRAIRGTGEKKELLFDTLISATGAAVDARAFAQAGARLSPRGLPETNAAGETSVPGLYVAGDCLSGPATVVKALAAGQAAARDILRKLGISPPARAPERKDCGDLDGLLSRRGVLEPQKAGIEEETGRCLRCDSLCEVCVEVCPNRANAVVSVSGFEKERQVVHVDRLCNECGACAVFCPHSGKPYKDKFTVFENEQDFEESENYGFLLLQDGALKKRLPPDRPASDFDQIIGVIRNEYPWLCGSPCSPI